MALPQDIRPVFQDIQDTLVRSEAPWVEQTPLSSVKVLWVGRETGTWASLHHWKRGYVAPPHKHLAGAHAFIIGGIGRARTDQMDGSRYFGEGGGGIMFGPYGVDLSGQYVVNRFDAPVSHSVHMIPICVRGTLTF